MTKKTENVVTSNELAVKNTATSAVAVASEVDEFAEDADKRTRAEVVLERIRIVQAMTKNKGPLKDGQLYGNMTRVGFDRLLIVPVYDYRTVVERADDKKGSFIKEHLETTDGSDDFGDKKVQDAIAAVGNDVTKLRKSLPDDKGIVTQLALTYNCFVAILDPSDGVTVTGFGVLQADKTNIRPYLLWRQNRVSFKGATSRPTYAFRTFVDGKGTYTNPEGNVTQQYNFVPFLNNSWKDSILNHKADENPDSYKVHYELLSQLREQRKLMQTGAIKVASNSEENTEEAAEEAAF